MARKRATDARAEDADSGGVRRGVRGGVNMKKVVEDKLTPPPSMSKRTKAL